MGANIESGPSFGDRSQMKVLVSPISPEETVYASGGGADIIDIKNVNEGSLGASFPWVIRESIAKVRASRPDVVFSATLGDLPYKPGTASLAALGAVTSGARYIKAGLYDVATYEQGVHMMESVARACREHNSETSVVTAGYADYRRFGGLSPEVLVQIAKDSGSDLVMVDTAIKDGKTLFDALPIDEINEFVSLGHSAGLGVALAGSVKLQHLPDIIRAGADIVGVRGAVCEGQDRTTRISSDKVRLFMQAVVELTATNNEPLIPKMERRL